jgi:hypothetical protein
MRRPRLGSPDLAQSFPRERGNVRPARQSRRTDKPSGRQQRPGGSKSRTAGGREGPFSVGHVRRFETTTSKTIPAFQAEYASHG